MPNANPPSRYLHYRGRISGPPHTYLHYEGHLPR